MGHSETLHPVTNVLGGPLEICCLSPLTGFYRDGSCHTGPDDPGVHAVCIEVTDEFLEFSRRAGNDLTTPRPEFGFPGLHAGDRWCLCAARWQEAVDATVGPPIILAATHAAALHFTALATLKQHALDFAS